jgi:hypothetical protein
MWTVSRIPLNVGLMFFNPAPQEFFPQAQIDLAQFPEDRAATFSPRILVTIIRWFL